VLTSSAARWRVPTKAPHFWQYLAPSVTTKPHSGQ
jgi:hypothetical protein